MSERAAWPIRAWYWFWIGVLYGLRLRRPLNSLQRRLQKERSEARLPLADLRTLDGLRAHLKPFDYRKDGSRIAGFFFPMDYVSDPEVFEARLRSGAVADGDCDDFAHYAATQLKRMGHDAYHVTIGYQGGGHVACVYRGKGDGTWYLMNYQTVTYLEHPQDAEEHLLKWATARRTRKHEKGTAKSRWLVFEDTNLKRVRL